MALITESHVPKYAQIADSLRQRIARGYWPTGMRLPANEELAAEFGVSRVTVRQAVDILAREGMLEARQGSGTYVTGKPAQDRWLESEPASPPLSSSIAIPRRRSSPSRKAPAAPILPEDGAGREIRLHAARAFARRRPYCVIAIHLAENVFRQHPERFRNETVIPILAEMREPASQCAPDVHHRQGRPRGRETLRAVERARGRGPPRLRRGGRRRDLSRRSDLSRRLRADRDGPASVKESNLAANWSPADPLVAFSRRKPFGPALKC